VAIHRYWRNHEPVVFLIRWVDVHTLIFILLMQASKRSRVVKQQPEFCMDERMPDLDGIEVGADDYLAKRLVV